MYKENINLTDPGQNFSRFHNKENYSKFKRSFLVILEHVVFFDELNETFSKKCINVSGENSFNTINYSLELILLFVITASQEVLNKL